MLYYPWKLTFDARSHRFILPVQTTMLYLLTETKSRWTQCEIVLIKKI